MGKKGNHAPWCTVRNVTHIPSGTYAGTWFQFNVVLDDGKDTDIFVDVSMPQEVSCSVEVTEETIKVYLS